MHTKQEKLAAAIAAMTKEGWPVEYYSGAPLLLSEGNLAVACFNAGYDFALPAPAATSVSGGAGDLALLANKLDEMATQSDASAVPDANATDYLRLLVKSRPQLTAALRALAASPASVTGPQELAPFFWTDCTPDEYGEILAAYAPLKQSHKRRLEEAYRVILTRIKNGILVQKPGTKEKAADAFVSVANGLCDAIEGKDWQAVYSVWRNIADVLIGHRPDLSEGIKPVPPIDAVEMAAALTSPLGGDRPGNFQPRVAKWMQETFGPEVSADFTERGFRFGEEAIELLQANGTTKEDILKLVDYVYGRPVGELQQEVGGTMVTLAALCEARGIDLMSEAATEQTRVESPEIRAKIQAKQEAKRARMIATPLPGIIPAAPSDATA